MEWFHALYDQLGLFRVRRKCVRGSFGGVRYPIYQMRLLACAVHHLHHLICRSAFMPYHCGSYPPSSSLRPVLFSTMVASCPTQIRTSRNLTIRYSHTKGNMFSIVYTIVCRHVCGRGVASRRRGQSWRRQRKQTCRSTARTCWMPASSWCR